MPLLQTQVVRFFCLSQLKLATHHRVNVMTLAFKRVVILNMLVLGLSAFGGLVGSKVSMANEADEFVLEPGNKPHVVLQGETLQSIARDEFGTTGLWRHIAEHNQLDANSVLQIGQVIDIPRLVKREREFASVIFVKGQVDITPASSGTTRPMEKTDKIRINDIITTYKSGFVSIQFLSGSVVNIQPATSVQLTKLRCLADDDDCLITLDARKGALSSDVKKKTSQETRFTITTPYASAAVRGTRFDVEATPENILVGVTEGAVDIEAQEVSNPLDIGFGIVTAAGQVPGQPIELTGPPTFRGVAARFTNGDKLSWWKVADSSNYIVTLSSDAGSQNIVSQRRQPSQVFEVTDLDDGEYFVNVRPVDSNGLKGFGTSQKLNIVSIDDSITGVALNLEKQGSDLLVSVTEKIESAEGYEFQLSPDPNFDDVISVDIGQSGSAIFRSPEEELFLRARALMGSGSVAPFGPTTQAN